MQNSSLLKILKSFSADEMKEFRNFIISPFFNKNKNTVKLFDYIKKHHPEFKSEKLSKDYIHKKLFGEENYGENFLRTAAFNLNKLAEDYLALKRFRRNSIKADISLLEELNERKLGRNFLKLHEQLLKDLEKSTKNNSDYFLNKYQIQLQYEIYMDWSRFMQKNLKSFSENYGEVSDSLTNYFLIKMLNRYRFIHEKKFWFPMKFDSDFPELLIDFLLKKKNKFMDYPKVRLHVYEILLHREQKHEYFLELKEMLNDTEVLSRSERYSLHNILQSYCIRRIFSGRENYFEERFHLYKKAVEQGLYAATEHLYIDDLFFLNAVNTAIQQDEMQWAEKFIKDHQDQLSPENKKIVCNLALSRFYFEEGKYEEAKALLSEAFAVKHIQFKYPYRDLILMINYELSDFLQLSYQTDSYAHFIKKYRNEQSSERHERIINFLKFFTKLYKLKENPDKERIISFEEELSRTYNIMERRWFMKKVKELLSIQNKK